MDKKALKRHGRKTSKIREGRRMIKFIYHDLLLTINGEETAENGDFIGEFTEVYEVVDHTAKDVANWLQKTGGIKGKEEFIKFIQEEGGEEKKGFYETYKLIMRIENATEDKEAGTLYFVLMASFYLRMFYGADFPFLEYLKFAYNKRTGDTIILNDDDAKAWNDARILNEEIRKNGLFFTAQQRTKPAEKEDKKEEIEDVETTTKNVVSHDFYKCLEKIQASETTKKIAEYVALSWGRTMREFSKANPEYNAVKKREAWKSGKIEIPADVIEPLYFTPTQLAKDFFPHDYKKVGQQKTARRALASFVPLTKATISETITDKSGKVVERVTPIFTISTDFVEGTPAEIKRLFTDDPTKFAEDEANLKYIVGFRVFPTIPLIANQFVNVGDVDTWRKHILSQRSEAVTMGGRRLGLLNVLEVSEAQIIKPEEQPARWKNTPTEKTKGFKAVADIAGEMYGKTYQYKPRQKKFVATLTKVKPADDVPEKESKQ